MKPTPPALPALPLVGNAVQFATRRHEFLREGLQRLGPIFSFKLARQPVAVLIGPEFHQEFFVQTDATLNIEKPYTHLAAMFGKVAFLGPHQTYLEQRPLLQAPFKPEKMARYVGIMQREVQRWIDGLGTQGEMDLSAEMGRLVQNVAGFTLMGEDFQNRVGREFWELYAVLGRTLNFVVPPHWPLPRNLRRDRARKRMTEILQPIIAERRAHPEKYDDFLQDFINTPTRSGTHADDETVVGLLKALMFASHETTAGQAAWTMIELLRHPGFHLRVQQEVATHLPAGTVMDHKVLRHFENILWAVREVERLHPSADMLMRIADVDIELGDYRIPQGWLVMVCSAVAHRSPTLFKDPDRFDPLRFAPDRAEDRQHGYALIGFGGGKHKCAGMNFANTEMMVITAMMTQQLELDLLTPNPRVHYGMGAGRPEKTLVRYRRRPVPLAVPSVA
ncbi:MAG: cytochrome P450 [Myxococcota bacterium]